MREMMLNELVVFDAVVRHGGVRAAARALGVSHSAVSRRIALLEQCIGEPLIDRSTGSAAGLRLSPRGGLLANQVRPHISGLEASLGGQRHHGRVQPVVVSTTNALASRWLIPRMARFRQTHPRVELSVQISRNLIQPGDAGVDVALRMGEGPWSGVHAVRWMDDVLVPVVGAALLERERTPLPLKALVRLPLLQDADPRTTWAQWAKTIGPAGLESRRPEIFDSSDLLLDAATSGLGVALARLRLASDLIRDGVLSRPFGPYGIRIPHAYWIVTRRNERSRPAVKAFIEWLLDEGRMPALS